MVGVAAMVVVIGGACGRDEPSGSRSAGVSEPAEVSVPATTVGATVVPTTQAMTEEQAVLAAVDGYWRTWEEANNPPDPDHPGLAKYFTGPALEKALQEIRNNQLVGVLIRRPPGSRTRSNLAVVAVRGDSAEVRDCSVDDLQVVSISTGAVLDADVVTHLFLHRLVFEGGDWRVAETSEIQKWEGEVECGPSEQ